IAAAQIILEVEEEEEEQSTTLETTNQNPEPTNNILVRDRQPELPEVEAARRAIADNCIGKKIIRSVVADDADVIHGVSRSVFEASLVGKTIVGVYRKGKNMWIQLDSPPFPSFQFGQLNFPAIEAPISELGPDAFMEPMTEDELFEALSKKKIAIKRLLLDQAKIHPLQVAASIPKEGCAALHMSLKEVIQHSVEVDAVIEKAVGLWLIVVSFLVTGFSILEKKKPGHAFLMGFGLCLILNRAGNIFQLNNLSALPLMGSFAGKNGGKTIKFINAEGQTTAYVPEVQKLTGDQAVKAAVKPQRTFCNRNNDEAESEGEEIAKPKGGKKTTQSGAKKPPAKRKPDTSDDDDTSDDSNDDNDTSDDYDDDTSDDYDDDGNNRKRPAPKDSPGNKKSPTRKKLKGSESDSDSGDEDDNE
ncbi:hypothetical protein M8C21_010872, partial [Ambrosia artemisiifolia]